MSVQNSFKVLSIVQAGRLLVPLFHGTSNLFLDSIMKYGLGGKSPIQTYDIIPFLNRLYQIGEKLFESDIHRLNPDCGYLEVRPYIRHIVKNGGRRTGSLFRYGHVTLTPSHLTATRYALSNRPFGSEILRFAYQTFRCIIERDSKYLHEKELASSPLFHLLHSNAQPIIIAAKGVKVTSLLSEKGETPNGNLRKIDKIVRKDGIEGLVEGAQQFNFESIKPITLECLKFYKISILQEDLYLPKYELCNLDL